MSTSKRQTPRKRSSQTSSNTPTWPEAQVELFAPWTGFELSTTKNAEPQDVSPRLQSFLRWSFSRPQDQQRYLIQRIMGMKPWYSKKRIRRFSDRPPFRHRRQAALFP